MKRSLALISAFALLVACGEDPAPQAPDSGQEIIIGGDAGGDKFQPDGAATDADASQIDGGKQDVTTDVADVSGDLGQDTADALEDTFDADEGPEPDVIADVEPEDAGPKDTSKPLTLCEQYCILSDLNCEEEYAIDFGASGCLPICGTWEEGIPGVKQGDSLQCRLYHLGVAAEDPATHCPIAAPDGGGVCIVPDYGNDPGDTCETAGIAVLSPGVNSGDTSLGFHDYSPGGCGFTNGASKDVVWILEPVISGVYTFTLDPTDGGPNVLYVFQDCQAISDTCLGFNNGFGGSSLEAVLVGGQSYYVVVDGWNAGQVGQFELQISPPCIPQCLQFQECGDDGCGGSCGTCNPNDPNGWITCDPATKTCVKPAEAIGNTCANAIPIGILPFTFSSSTVQATNNYGYGPSVCPGVEYYWGNGSNDHAFLLTPSDTAIYEISLEANFDTTLYVVGDCGDVDGSCVGAAETFGPETLELELFAGTPYYIIVDGYGNDFNESGDYTLHIAEPCIPQCELGYCGSDGCGGECVCGAAAVCYENSCCVPICDGTNCGPLSDGCGGECGCDLGLACTPLGVCDIAPLGDQCINPNQVLQNPFSQPGATEQAYDDYEVSEGACGQDSPAFGAGAKDVVYGFVPNVSGTYTLKLTANFAAVVYVVTNCLAASDTCLGYDHVPGPKTVNVSMQGGVTYYIIIDGIAEGPNSSGAYVLQIAAPCLPQCDGLECGDDSCGGVCGVCGPNGQCDLDQQCEYPVDVGDDCEAPFVIESLPFEKSGDTTDSSNSTKSTAPTCFEVGNASGDNVYQLTIPATGLLKVTVTGKDGFDPVLYLRKECTALPDGTCIDATTNNGVESLEIAVSVGEIWHIFVDGWNNSVDHSGPYDLQVSLSEEGGQPGDDCFDATVISAFPASVFGDTANAADDLEAVLCNPGAFDGGKDQVWILEPNVTGTYSFVLSGVPTLLYVLTDCADSSNCQGFKSFFGDLVPTKVALEAGTTYYVIVDGYAQWEAGPYELSITFDGVGPEPEKSLLVINELDYDQPGADSTEFVEILNPTDQPIGTAGLYLVYINGSTGLPYATLPLDNIGLLEPGDYAVIGSLGALATVPLGVPTLQGPFSIQNGAPDAVALVAGDPTQEGAVAWDVVTYEGTIDALTDGSSWWVSEGNAGEDNDVGSLNRCPNGVDSGDNGSDFKEVDPTPGQTNLCEQIKVFVTIDEFAFAPVPITIAPGTTVVWTNAGSMQHTVTSTDGITTNVPTYEPLNSELLAPGAAYQHTFEAEGLYSYRCEPHAQMKGIVIVE